jgi:hypothetical protein
MSQLQSWMAVLSRRGRVGSVVLVVLGVVIIGFGVALIVDVGGAGIWGVRGGASAIGVVLALVVVGLVLVGLGGGALFGAQARMARAVAAHPEAPLHPRADPRAVARAEPVPFWICSDCRLVEPGLSGCCIRCGQTVAFVQVTREDERSIAVSSLH